MEKADPNQRDKQIIKCIENSIVRTGRDLTD